MLLKLADESASLPDGWQARSLADFGCVRAKLFKVDPAGLAEECHLDWDEALLMVDGDLTLVLDGVRVVLQTGDFLLIPRGVPHRILPGGHGAFVLLDPDPGVPSSE